MQQHHPQHHEDFDLDAIPTDLPKVRTWSVLLAFLVLAGVLVSLFFVGYAPRQKRLARLNQDVEATADLRPAVDVVPPTRTEPTLDIVLPADAQANQETALFPRASGFLKALHVDIGDVVKEGQLLAEIDAPDLEAELAQARASEAAADASVIKARNDLELAQATLTRYEGFAKTGGVTQQQLDEKRSAFTQAKSNLESAAASVKVAQANVQRLSSLAGFTKIYAPFAGTVTARNFDVGALTSATQQQPLFRLADTHVLRVFVNVPQSYVHAVKPGQEVAVAVRNYPGRSFPATVARTSGALDPASRTLRYQVDVPNDKGLLFAGMYAEVRIKTVRPTPPLIVPTSAVVFDASGTKVWTVQDSKAHQKKVDVGRDFGTEIEIATGLEGDEEVITNPASSLAEGDEVNARLPQTGTARSSPPQDPKRRQAAAR